VLEIGTGSGYNAALLAHVVGETGAVVSVDIDADIAADARERLAACGVSQVTVCCGDGGLGWSEHAPYDRIIATVGAVGHFTSVGGSARPTGSVGRSTRPARPAALDRLPTDR
jgi:protein-L-isoaspartate O-methyltransferase